MIPESATSSTPKLPVVQKHNDLEVVSLQKAMNDRCFYLQPECRLIVVRIGSFYLVKEYKKFQPTKCTPAPTLLVHNSNFIQRVDVFEKDFGTTMVVDAKLMISLLGYTVEDAKVGVEIWCFCNQLHF